MKKRYWFLISLMAIISLIFLVFSMINLLSYCNIIPHSQATSPLYQVYLLSFIVGMVVFIILGALAVLMLIFFKKAFNSKKLDSSLN